MSPSEGDVNSNTLSASLRRPPPNPAWVRDAEAAIHQVASDQREFTTDDVWALLAESKNRTAEHRTMGPLMVAAQRRGWIEATHSTIISNRRRGAPVRVWRSNIYRVRSRRESMS